MNEKKEYSSKFTLMNCTIALSIAAPLLLGILLIIMNAVIINVRTNQDYQSIARAATTHAYSWLTLIDEGDFTYDEASGKVYKGETEITDAAFQYIHADNANMQHTLFWGKTRVISDIKDDKGVSVVGSSLSDDTIWNAVNQNGYYCENNVVIYGKKYTVCYTPIKNGDTMVGMLFTGVNQTAANKKVIKDVLIAVGIALACILVIGLVVRSILKLFTREFLSGLERADALANEKNANVTSFGNQTEETMEQINCAVDQVTLAVTDQASHTEEIMGTMEEFGANIDLIVNNVESTSEIAQESINAINELQNQLNALERVSNSNSYSIEEISRQIEEDSNAVRSIGKITDVINDIAFQITILSYNASVEAAHAGEFGKSFAVVADSIKDLSDKTKASLEDITNIIADVNEKMAATGESSAKLVAENNKVVEALAETRNRLSDVTESYNTILDNIDQVMEQSASIETAKDQVIETVSSLAAMGEENAAMSEEMKASTDEVLHLTESLLDEIKGLEAVNDIILELKTSFA